MVLVCYGPADGDLVRIRMMTWWWPWAQLVSICWIHQDHSKVTMICHTWWLIPVSKWIITPLKKVGSCRGNPPQSLPGLDEPLGWSTKSESHGLSPSWGSQLGIDVVAIHELADLSNQKKNQPTQGTQGLRGVNCLGFFEATTITGKGHGEHQPSGVNHHHNNNNIIIWW